MYKLWYTYCILYVNWNKNAIYRKFKYDSKQNLSKLCATSCDIAVQFRMYMHFLILPPITSLTVVYNWAQNWQEPFSFCQDLYEMNSTSIHISAQSIFYRDPWFDVFLQGKMVVNDVGRNNLYPARRAIKLSILSYEVSLLQIMELWL